MNILHDYIYFFYMFKSLSWYYFSKKEGEQRIAQKY